MDTVDLVYTNYYQLVRSCFLTRPSYIDRDPIHCLLHNRHLTVFVLLHVVYGVLDYRPLKFTYLWLESGENTTCWNLPTVKNINRNTITLNSDITRMEQGVCICI